MSKRRLSKQQQRRLQGIQQDHLSDQIHKQGLVVACFGREAIVEDEQGQEIQCAIKPNLSPLAAGDRVIWQAKSEHQGLILSQSPRETVIGRMDRTKTFKPIAANLSQIVIVTAPKPLLSWILLDSYLVMAECLNISPLIVLNKIDLEESNALKKELEIAYRPLGYRLCYTSQSDVSSLLKELTSQISVFVGQSGVGKSSLIRQILPKSYASLQSGPLSDKTDLGRHTTSNSTLYHLTCKGALIDSPGIRELNLSTLSLSDVIYGFPEFRNLRGQCKFRNCNHQDNPGCAIYTAVKEHPELKRRYQSLVRIMAAG